MDSEVLPSLKRLNGALEAAARAVQQTSQIMRQAEEEAARLLGPAGLGGPIAAADRTAAGATGGEAGGAAAGPTPIDSQGIRQRIEQHEGREAHVYPDTEGNPTIGVGFNLNRADARQRIEALGLSYDDVRAGQVDLTEAQIDQLLEADVDTAIQDARALFPNFDTLTAERQRALTDMAFNLGSDRLAGFRDLRDAVQNEDWERAAEEMRDSRWADQVGQRADHDIEDMRGAPPNR